MHALTPTLQAELVGRLLLAVLLGSVLGWERETARHPAGLRTHMLVSLGAAACTAVISFAVLRLIKGAERAPQALGRAVASRFARRAAPQRDVTYQPARAPAVMEAPPRVPVPDGQAEPGEVPSPGSDDEPALVEPETPAIEPAGEPDGRDQVHKKLTKKLRKGKKGRKGKQRDFVSEDSDH